MPFWIDAILHVPDNAFGIYYERGTQQFYPCTVDNRDFELVEAISFQETGEAQANVEGDELVLPCRSGFVRARFLKV